MIVAQQNFRKLLNPLHREGWFTEGLHGDSHKLYRVIVRRNTVGAQRSAPSATMDYRPFAVLSHPDRNSIHNTAAVGSAVARLDVQMQAGKAVRAMVAMIAARALRRDTPSADLAGEAVVAGMGFVLSFCVLFPFVFAIH